jgi:hypothetical protein
VACNYGCADWLGCDKEGEEVMDFDTIGKLLLILLAIPFVIVIWSCALALVDDCFCNGEIRYKIKQWVGRKLEG